LALLAAVVCAGCATRPVVSEHEMDPAQERLLTVGQAYSQFNYDKDRPPRGPQDLKDYLAKSPGPDQVLQSPRDGQPFVICWGVDLRVPPEWAKSRPALAYEKSGSGGRRFVLTTMRNVELVADADFRQSSFPPGHSPPP
jgi:hypothetical protein